MARTKNPRRTVLATVMNMKRLLERTRNIWTVASIVYTESGTRPREAHEYPENTKEDWNVLIVDMDTLIAQAEALKHMAQCKRDHLRWPDRVAPCGCARVTLNGAPVIQHSYRKGVCLDGETGYQLD